MDPGPLGTIGVGMPFCIGAKQADPDREVMCLFGDGAFSLTGFDFDTRCASTCRSSASSATTRT
jgi:acetolactate synthase-1/2/3 large subunit